VKVRKLGNAEALECFGQTGQSDAPASDFHIDAGTEEPIGSSPEWCRAYRNRHLTKQMSAATGAGRDGAAGRLTYSAIERNSAAQDLISDPEKHHSYEAEEGADQPYRKDPINEGPIKPLVTGMNYMTRKNHF